MFEIEKKFKISESKKREVLNSWHQRKLLLSEYSQTDEIFLYGVNSFKEFTQGDPVIRLRKNNNTSILTFKKVVDNKGTTVEHESSVSDPQSVRQILLQLGFLPTITVNKKRTETQDDGFTLAIDHVEHLGFFLEIEVLSKTNDTSIHDSIIKKALEYEISADQIEDKKYDRLLNDLD